VARNFAAPEGAFPELSASPPAAPVAAAAWGGRGETTRGDMLDCARFAAPPRASPPRAVPPPATTWGGRGAAVVAAAPPPKPKKTVKKTLSLTGGGRRY